MSDMEKIQYKIVKATYNQLLTALQVSLLNEKFSGADERRADLLALAEEYKELCDELEPTSLPPTLGKPCASTRDG